jgi:hypothetical protein
LCCNTPSPPLIDQEGRESRIEEGVGGREEEGGKRNKLVVFAVQLGREEEGGGRRGERRRGDLTKYNSHSSFTARRSCSNNLKNNSKEINQ